MATCSFINATNAINLSRNNTVIWGEICELQSAILTAIDSNQRSVIVSEGTPFTFLGGIESASLDDGGSGYSVAEAVAVINENGTGGSGAALTPAVSSSGAITGFDLINGGSGYAPVSATASVGSLYDLIDAQDETNYDGVAGNGTFTGGATYRVGEVISLSEGSTATVDTITNSAVVLVQGQNETDYNGFGRQLVDVGGNKASGTATGLTNDATVYTADLNPNSEGVDTLSVTGSAAQTYGDLITVLNAETDGNATWSLDPATGNLRCVSTANAELGASTIVITDVDLLSSLTGFVAVETAIAGDNVGIFNGGDGVGITEYVAGTTIEMEDGSVITIGTVDGNGDVVTFTVTQGSTSSFSSAEALSQTAASNGALGFTLTPGLNNEIAVGPVTEFTIGSAGEVPFSLPATIPQIGKTGIGTGFTLTPAITANAIYAGGEFLANDYTSLAFNDANPDTIVRTGGTAFDVDATALAAGDRIRIANADDPANDGIYTILTVTATTITLTGADALTADAADTNATIQRVDNTGAILTPLVSSGVITGVGINSPGSGYMLNQPILISHPSGTGAEATVTALNGSQGITAITVTAGGSGYETVSPTISITHPTGFAFEGTVQILATEATLTITAAGGNVTAVNVVSGGTGYANGTGFTFTVTDSTLAGDGNAVISYNVVNGSITNDAVVDTAGSGYANATNILVSSVDAPNSDGAVAGISIQDNGSLYGPVYPYVVISDSTGSGAELNVTGVSGGAISSIQLADGGYSYTAPTVQIYNSDDIVNNSADITFTLESDVFNNPNNPSDYYLVLSGQSSDRVVSDQLQYVLDYFTALGYNIRAQVNPATNNTIQWQIIW